MPERLTVGLNAPHDVPVGGTVQISAGIQNIYSTSVYYRLIINILSAEIIGDILAVGGSANYARSFIMPNYPVRIQVTALYWDELLDDFVIDNYVEETVAVTNVPSPTLVITSPLPVPTGGQISFTYANFLPTAYVHVYIQSTDTGQYYWANGSGGGTGSFSVGGLPAGSYILVARDENNGSQITTSFNITGPAAIPNTPVLVSPADGVNLSGTTATFRWVKSTGAVNYWLSVTRVSDWVAIFSQPIGDVDHYDLSGLPNDGTYFYWTVAAGNTVGWSAAATLRSFTNGGSPPAAPTMISPAVAAQVPGTSVEFKWTASPSALGYWLAVVYAANGSAIVNEDVGNVTTITKAGFPNDGSLLSWTVVAGNANGWGPTQNYRNFINGPIINNPSIKQMDVSAISK